MPRSRSATPDMPRALRSPKPQLQRWAHTLLVAALVVSVPGGALVRATVGRCTVCARSCPMHRTAVAKPERGCHEATPPVPRVARARPEPGARACSRSAVVRRAGCHQDLEIVSVAASRGLLAPRAAPLPVTLARRIATPRTVPAGRGADPPPLPPPISAV